MENIKRMYTALWAYSLRKHYDVSRRVTQLSSSRASSTSKLPTYVKENLSRRKDWNSSFGSRHITCLSCEKSRVQKFDNKLTPTRARHFRDEIKAIRKILQRSAIPATANVRNIQALGIRCFSTGKPLWQQPPRKGPQDENDPNKDPPEEDKMPFTARLMLLFWLSFLLYVTLRLQTGEDANTYRFVSWNEFVHDMLSKGEVEEVIVRPEAEMAFIRLHQGAIIKGRKSDSEFFTLKIVDPYKFEDKVRKAEADLGIKPERGIAISYQRESSWTPIIFMAIVGIVLFLVFRNVVKIQLPNPTDIFASERKAKFVRVDLQTMQGKGVSFRDVAGLKEAKVEVMEFVDYLKRPERYKELGGRVPHGALLTGPPGCGKTLLAKAVATEAKVPFLATAGSEFVEMLGGLGAARVRDIFKEARDNSPCIIYIDEIDAIGKKRGGNNVSGTGGSEEEHTLNQLLVEMDGMGTTDGVIILASTNRVDVLDKALLRPGRFDRHILIDLPTLEERKEMFMVYLQRLLLAQPPESFRDRLAQLSPGMSGADIANICNEAALHAARVGKAKVDSPDFEYAVERVVAGAAKKSGILSPKEKKTVAYHEAGHAVVGWLLENTDALLKVSIVPRTSNALGFAQYMPMDRKLHSKEELFERMCMALGGRVSESVHFNSVTSGAHDDLRKVSKMAYTQIRLLGMNERLGLVSFPESEDKSSGARPYSKLTANMIDEEARSLVARAYQATEALVLANKEKIRVVAEALLEKETLNYNDMEELIGPPPHGKKRIVSEWDIHEPPSPVS